MTNVLQRLTAADVGRALLVVGDPRLDLGPARQQLAEFLLPHTDATRVTEALFGLGDLLTQGWVYAHATAATAREWFGECGCDNAGCEAMADCLHERAGYWRAEAETFATTVALHDLTLPHAVIPFTKEH